MSDKARRYDYSPAEFLEGVSNLTLDEIEDMVCDA